MRLSANLMAFRLQTSKLYYRIMSAHPVLRLATMFLAVLGIFTFPLFICNEATRVAVWATWQADNTELYILKEGVDVIRAINGTSKGINYTGGWLHPISFQGYRAFTKATDYWLLTAESRILSHDPKLMDGSTVTVMFRPRTIESTTDGVLLINDKVRVKVKTIPETDVFWITGKCKWTGEHLLIETTQEPTAKRP
jgi:hypothetical protein